MCRLNDRVDVGGCVGIITNIDGDDITVSGTYYYVGGGREHWKFHYKKTDFKSMNTTLWNLQDAEPISYY